MQCKSLEELPDKSPGSVRVYLIRHGEVFNPRGVVYGRVAGFELSKAGMDMAKRTAAEVQEAVMRDMGLEGSKVSPVGSSGEGTCCGLGGKTAAESLKDSAETSSAEGIDTVAEAANGTSAHNAVQVIASPLIRTKQSAYFILEALTEKGLFEWDGDWADICKDGVIEPWSVFEGNKIGQQLLNPMYWWHLRKPSIPSWGEPFVQIFDRFYTQVWYAAMKPGVRSVVVVTHQSPISLMTMWVAGKQFAYVHPDKRRCGLSSATVFDFSAETARSDLKEKKALSRFCNPVLANRKYWKEVGYFACV